MRDARPRLRAGLIAASALAALLVVVLAGLGVWQVQRLQWKTDLIARVEAQVQAPAIPAPMDWSSPAALEEYRPVTLSGRYRPEAEALVKAVTQEGGGFWVMTPLTGDQGGTVWINRGFVPQDRAGHPADWRAPEGRVSVTGLLRTSQPGGGFLRKNDPAGDRWFSRDTQALAQARGLGPVAPYFIDAERGTGALPIGGLTVVSFRNSHLSYALTWFGMAAGLGAASIILLGREWRKTRPRSGR